MSDFIGFLHIDSVISNKKGHALHFYGPLIYP